MDTENDTWRYPLTLDEDAMKEVAYAAAPEIKSLPAGPEDRRNAAFVVQCKTGWEGAL